MSLVNLVNITSFKSLKYGADLLGGGDSGQPYITTDINNQSVGVGINGPVTALLQRAGLPPSVTNLITKDSGFIRGGFVGAANSSINDTVRIAKWVVDNPLWVVKQVGLQLSNPRLETPKNPLLLTNAGNILSRATNGILEPTRTYNLGINTLLQIPVNAFGGHFYRHGLGPNMDDNQKYEAIARANNDSGDNRLLKLITKLNIGGPTIPTSPLLNGIFGFLSNVPILGSIIKSLTGNTPIDDYLTGPGSVYGIGSTTIRRFDNTTSVNTDEFLGIAHSTAIFNTRTYNDSSFRKPTIGLFLGLSKKIQNYIPLPDNVEGSITYLDTNTAVDYQGASPALRSYKNLFKAVKATTSIIQSIPFSDSKYYSSKGPANSPFGEGRKDFKTISNIGLNRDRKEQHDDYHYYGDKKISDDGSQAVYDNTYKFDRYDSDILTIMFRGVDPFSQNEERWAFSAYMSGYKDDFNATWNDINYIGRSETFYLYSKFKRSVSFNLQIPCFNRTQLFEKHRALGQLASTTAGRYNGKNNALGGMLLRLNVGSYLVGEYAAMTNLSYNIPDTSAWDITPEARLAMYIDASFSFNIIHQKLPQYLPSQQNPKAGFFGYLRDSVPGDAQFIKIPNRTTEEQNLITEGFSVNLKGKSTKGTRLSSTNPAPVLDFPYYEFKQNLRPIAPQATGDPNEIDPSLLESNPSNQYNDLPVNNTSNLS